MAENKSNEILEKIASKEYEFGFSSNFELDTFPKGLNEDTIKKLSFKKEEPEFMLNWRLNAYKHWLKMDEPKWPNVTYPPVDYQDIIYYAAPKKAKKINIFCG